MSFVLFTMKINIVRWWWRNGCCVEDNREESLWRIRYGCRIISPIMFFLGLSMSVTLLLAERYYYLLYVSDKFYLHLHVDYVVLMNFTLGVDPPLTPITNMFYISRNKYWNFLIVMRIGICSNSLFFSIIKFGYH